MQDVSEHWQHTDRHAGERTVGWRHAGVLATALAIIVISAGDARAGPIVLSELMYNPPVGDVAYDNDDYEFVEVLNTSASPFPLTGAVFTDGISYTFGTRTLAPGERVVVVKHQAAFSARYPGVTALAAGPYGGKLANGGDRVTLKDVSGTTLFSVAYDDTADWPYLADGFGSSLVLHDTSANPDLPSSWCASAEYLGAPGIQATCAGGEIRINEVLSHTDPPLEDAIELYNRSDATVEIGGWYLSDDAAVLKKYRLSDGLSIPAGGYHVFYEYQFNSTNGTNVAFALSEWGEAVFLTAADATDSLTRSVDAVTFGASENGVSFGRYPNGIGELATLKALTFGTGVTATNPPADLAQFRTGLGESNSAPLVGPIIISEIMYNPVNEDFEYIELLNTSVDSVDLFSGTNGWRLTSAVEFTFPAGTTLASGERVLVAGTNPPAFRTAYGIAPTVTVFGPWTGRLSNGGESIALRKPGATDTNGVPYIGVEQVDYDDDSPWPVAADGKGASLERLDLSTYANDPFNWFAGGIGGSPGGAPAGGFYDVRVLPSSPFVAQAFTVEVAVVAGTLPTQVVVRISINGVEADHVMHDDGTSADRIAGDRIYAVELQGQPDGTWVYYQFAASISNGMSFVYPSPFVAYDDAPSLTLRMSGGGLSTTVVPSPEWQPHEIHGQASHESLFYVYLNASGEALIDDVSITESGSQVEHVVNGEFESSITNLWYPTGNHAGAYSETLASDAGNSALHLVATGAGDSVSDSVRSYLSPSVSVGTPLTLRFRTRQTSSIERDQAWLWVAVGAPSPDVLISEVMYHDVAEGAAEEAYEYIELYNPGSSSVDLSGWRIDGVRYTIPSGGVINASEYLVCCASQSVIRVEYGITNTIGDWGGALQNSGESLRLINRFGRVVDSVRYDDKEPWPVAADGYGASLERIHADTTGDSAANWAASRVTTNWQQVVWTSEVTTANTGVRFFLDFDGSCWIDDVSVTPVGGGAERVANGNFENGAADWTALGNHSRSRVEPGMGLGGSSALALAGTTTRWILIDEAPWLRIEYGDAVSNAVHSLPLSTTPGADYILSFWVRRRGLSSDVCYTVDAVTNHVSLATVGTPGRANTTASAVPPVGFSAVVQTYNILPVGTGNVIRATVTDPNGVTNVSLHYRSFGTNGYEFTDSQYASLALLDDGVVPDTAAGDGEYAVTMPSFTTNWTVVRYHLTVLHTNGYRGRSPRREDPAPDFAFWVQSDSVQAQLPNWHVFTDGEDLYPVVRRATAVSPDGQVFVDISARHRGSPGYNTRRTGIGLRMHRGHELNAWFADQQDGINFRFRGNGPPERPWYDRLVAEVLAYDLQHAIGLPTPRVRHTCLWINGSPTVTVELEHPGAAYSREYGIPEDDYLGRWGNLSYNPMQGEESLNNRYAVTVLLNAATGGAKRAVIADNFVYETCRYVQALVSLTGNADQQFLWNMFNQRSATDGRWSYYPWDVDYSFRSDYTTLHPYYTTHNYPDIAYVDGKHLTRDLFYPETGVEGVYTLPYRHRQQQSLWRYAHTLFTTNSLFPKLDALEADLKPAYAQIGESDVPMITRVQGVKDFITARREFLLNASWQDKDPDVWRHPYVATNVVINELMIDPSRGGEYVELYNTGSQAIDLSWWMLKSGEELYRFPHGTMLPPYDYLVVTDRASALTSAFPDFEETLVQRYAGMAIWDRPIDWNTRTEYATRMVEIPQLTLPNNGATLALLDLRSNTIDTVTYSALTPWPVDVPLGTALELTDVTTGNDTGLVWLACSSVGTPGGLNTAATDMGGGMRDRDAGYADVAIYHDSTNTSANAPLYVNSLRNLLGHFRTNVKVYDVATYGNGDLHQFHSVFYIGSTFDVELPDAFLADVAAATNTVVWLNYSIWKLLESTNDTSHIGLTYHIVTNGYTDVTYKDEWLYKHPNSSLVTVSTNGTQTVYAWAAVRTNAMITPVPYATRAGTFWYIADNPFSWPLKSGRALVLADLLHDILDTGMSGAIHRALVRVEDVNPGTSDLSLIQAIADTLEQLNVPSTFGVIPRYRWPSEGLDEPMSRDAAFIESVRHIRRTGATLLDHGYTHQREDQQTAVGWEFWDESLDAPVAGDSWIWASGRVEAAADELMKSGFAISMWETPHYSASLLDYHVFADRYNVLFERVSYAPVFAEGLSRTQLAAVSASDPALVGQDLPYVAHRSTYGPKLLPENLGYVDPLTVDTNGLLQSVSNKVAYARKHRVVRDAVASFCYHPDLGLDYMTTLVQEIRALGYTFVDPAELLDEGPVGLRSDPTPADVDTSRTYNGSVTNLLRDVVIGESGRDNSFHISGGGVVSNRSVIVGVGIDSHHNTALASGAGTLWVSDGDVVVGHEGDNSSLIVSNGAVLGASEAVIGQRPGADANAAHVTGSGSRWTLHFGLKLGPLGDRNRLDVTDGGTVHAGYAEVGAGHADGGNAVRVSGVGSSLTNDQYLVIGGESAGNSLQIDDGASVGNRYAFLGLGNHSPANSAMVSGVGSTWTSSEQLTIGVDSPSNSLVVSSGAVVSAGDLLIGRSPYAVDNTVTVSDGGSLNVAGTLELRRGSLHLTSGSASIGQLLVSEGAIVNLSNGFDLGGSGTITNAGWITLVGDLAMPGDLVIVGNGEVSAPSGVWTIGGNFSSTSTMREDALLQSTLGFTSGATHSLHTDSADMGASLAGFIANHAIGTLWVRGTVQVSGTVYAWALKGDGTLELDSGDRVYYASVSDWSGVVSLTGDAIFERVPVALKVPGTTALGNTRLQWPAAVGLNFGVDWVDSLNTGVFRRAATLVADESLEEWIDMGDVDRPAPTNTLRRFYRLQSWP